MPTTLTEITGTGTQAQGKFANLPVIDAAATNVPAQMTLASGVNSAQFGGSTYLVQIDSDVAVRVEFGTNPTGAGIKYFIPAGDTREFGVLPGWRARMV
jgi:copper(I)-binding protein